MQVAKRPARLAMSSLGVLKRPEAFSADSTMSSRARPESMALATKIGAMMAENQPSLAICRPKIQAVTECTKMAQGRAKRDTMATARSAPLRMKCRYRMLMTR